MEVEQRDEQFWLELNEILKRNDRFKDIEPEEFCRFVETLIDKYY